jgi:transcriptional regulator with XRE-family HTH domain
MGIHFPPVNNLPALRVARGWSQEKAATAAGLTAARYWRIERGVSRPRPSELEGLVQAFDTTDLGFPGSPANVDDPRPDL